MNAISETGERISPEECASVEEYLLYLRCLFAYEYVKDVIFGSGLVFELGCGEGYGTRLLSGHVQRIIAADRDRNTVEHAAGKYGSENCMFMLSDGRRLPFDDGVFDAVVSFQLIEHVEDDAGLVSEIHRVLRAGGTFILTTPNSIRRLGKTGKPWNRFHIREYESRELEELLKSRFSDVTIRGVRGNDEIERIETERIRKTLKIRSLDPLNLRRLIPEPLRLAAMRILGGTSDQNIKTEADYHEKYNLKDYRVVDEHLEDSLDLLAVCRK